MNAPTTDKPATPAPPPEASELVFGRYQIIRRLAVGGMGEVFLARQSGVAGFDRLVILKSLLPDLAQQSEFVEQFLDEARVAATLNHPNIVSIYEVGRWNDTYYIAMEYIRGDNLSILSRAAAKAEKPISHKVAAFIVHDAAQALDHAHKAKDLSGVPLTIVHRDVSPQNIMVRMDGVTKVVDFGIAKAANRNARTATGLLKGKVQYMAPEQIGGEELDGRADQFALGVVLWELIAQKKLFSGNTDIDILKQVLAAPIPSLLAVGRDVHPVLARVVDTMLKRDREQRYPSLAEAAHEIKKYLDEVGIKDAQEQTASFVQETLGDEINSKTIDLTPSGANNFVINLSGSQGTAMTGMTAQARAKSRAAAAVAVLFAAALGIAAAWFVLTTGDEAPSPAQPTVVTQRSVMAIATEPTGARVTVDGVDRGTSPMQHEATPDVVHDVKIVLAGYEDMAFQATLKPGDVQTFMKTLKKLAGVLELTSDPPGADVSLRGQQLGKTPLTIDVVADELHEYRLALLNGKQRLLGSVGVTLAPGEKAQKLVRLKEGKAPTPVSAAPSSVVAVDVEPGVVTIRTEPWTKIAIDGEPHGSTPIANVRLRPGKHTVQLVNEEKGVNETRTIVVKAGEKTKLNWTLK